MQRYGIVLVILGSVLWGTDSLFRRPLTQQLSPITIVLLEHAILVLVLMPLLLRARREVSKLKAKDWVALIFIAIGGSVAATALFTYAIKYGNPSVTVLLQKTQPCFTILLARWLLAERPSSLFWILLPPALTGAYLVAAPDWRAGFSLNPGQPSCIIAAVAASCLWGASTVFGRYIVARLQVLTLTGLRFAIALPVLLILYWVQTPANRQVPSTVPSVSAIAAMALIPGLAALVCYYRGLLSTIASHASLGELAFPLTAVTANWFVLGIALAPSQILGGLLLVSSVTALTFLSAGRTNPAGKHT